ncbi:glycosyltransferase family 61 protein [Paraburkholderia sediminicola]|uniref:glycosyltransferase family 61 protein n=1 Tax=Paraburkholderia sediminicola TaxID=458836 RepID=UPI0038B9AF9B
MKSLSSPVKILLVKFVSLLHLIDKDYYLKRYPDVATAKLDPVEHYVIYGFREGRSPNRWLASCKDGVTLVLRSIIRRLIAFDADYYLMQYPDVASAGLDPVTHYMRNGFWEGRSPNRKFAKHKRSLKIVVAFLSTLTRRQLIAQTHFGHEVIFGFAKGGRRRLVRVVILIEQYLVRRRQAKIYVKRLPIANLANEEFDWASVTPIEPAKPFRFCEPEIIGEDASCTPRTVELPKKWVASISNALIIGGFQVIAQGHFVLYEPAGDPRNDFVAGSWPFVAGIKNTDAAVVWYEYENRATIPEGILISGRCSPNYYHWLIEYLARIYSVLPLSDLHKVPLIVDASMYPQEFESLAAVCPNWPVYAFKKGTLLEVEKLHIPSIPTFLPDTLEIPFWKASALCHSTLTFLRNAVFGSFAIENTRSTRKIFLARMGARNITNMSEIEAVLTDYGFECVDTGSLTFEAQVRLFADAAVIVGPLGAAFSNAIFCNPGCKIVGLASPYGKRFCMQGNLAAFAGCEYKILGGEHPMYQAGDEYTVRDVELMHESFAISPRALIAALEDLGVNPVPQSALPGTRGSSLG